MILRKPNNVVPIDKYSLKWRYLLPAIVASKKKKFIDENNNTINPFYYEIFEQYLINKWLNPSDKVLELGGRLGVISYTINSILKNKKSHVVIEPNKVVLKALKKNRNNFGSEYLIVTKILSNKKLKFVQMKNSLGSFATDKYIKKNEKIDKITNIDIIKFKDFIEEYSNDFTVLVSDCEGCLCNFFKNIKSFPKLEVIIFEKDNEKYCNYDEIYKILENNSFKKYDEVLYNFQQVFIKFIN